MPIFSHFSDEPKMNTIQSLYNQIEQIAQGLRQAGKTPSLALIRARIGAGVSAAELMTAYQRWHNTHGSLASAPAALPVAAVATCDSSISPADFQRLEAKVDLILQLLQQQSHTSEKQE